MRKKQEQLKQHRSWCARITGNLDSMELSAWEEQFLENVEGLLKQGAELSDKQSEALEEMHERSLQHEEA